MLLLCSFFASTQFHGDYNVSNWTLTNSNGAFILQLCQIAER
jgi:hypothetical protein